MDPISDAGGSGLGAGHVVLREELYSLRGRQSEREHPVDLPRSRYYEELGGLLRALESELAQAAQTEGFGWGTQATAKRQAQVRRDLAELVRQRLNAFAHHATAVLVRAAPASGESGPAHLPPLEWGSHDPAERRFYEGLRGLIGRFLDDMAWQELQQGDIEVAFRPALDPGTRQLDAFVDDSAGLTGAGPPIVDRPPSAPPTFHDPDEEDEGRIARLEEYPEWDKHSHPPPEDRLDEDAPPPWFAEPAPMPIEPPMTVPRPSPQASLPVEPEPPAPAPPTPEPAPLASTPAAAPPAPAPAVLPEEDDQPGRPRRIRITGALPEPIIDGVGDELDLQPGDVHILDGVLAGVLIEQGFAEAADL